MLVKISSPFDDFGLYALGFLVNAGTKLGLTEGSSSNKKEGKDDSFHEVYCAGYLLMSVWKFENRFFWIKTTSVKELGAELS
jgi:hypothetical protein